MVTGFDNGLTRFLENYSGNLQLIYLGLSRRVRILNRDQLVAMDNINILSLLEK